MKKAYHYLGITVFTMIVVGCQRSSYHNKSYTKSAAQEAENNQVKTTWEEGKRKMESPETFWDAKTSFESALSQSPLDPLATLYIEITKIWPILMGLPLRLSHLIGEEIVQEGLEKKLKEYEANPPLQALVRSLLYGGNPTFFKSVHEVQIFVESEVLPALQKAQAALAQVETQKFLIELRTDQWHRKETRESKLFLDPTDVHGLRMYLYGLETISHLFLAYDLDFLLPFRTQFEKPESRSYQTILSEIKKYPSALTLRKNGKEHFQALLKDVQATLEGQRTLAKALYEGGKREDFVLTNPFYNFQGFSDWMHGLNHIEDVIAGPYLLKLSDAQAVMLNVPHLLHTPPKDLKQLFPTQFSNDGQKVKATSFPDPTFAGLIPDGDFIEKYCSVPNDVREIRLSIQCGEGEEKELNNDTLKNLQEKQ
ncbi:MAG: hypothetical protein HY390_01615 [Deltaproteobacteria bacterium]|nr:hypothetical protein [Deltaproteobacteria bacterium]